MISQWKAVNLDSSVLVYEPLSLSVVQSKKAEPETQNARPQSDRKQELGTRKWNLGTSLDMRYSLGYLKRRLSFRSTKLGFAFQAVDDVSQRKDAVTD